VLAGNVAGLAIGATLEALLARSAVLLKPAAGDRVTPRLFLESLGRAAPAAANAVAIGSWRGGDLAVEETVFPQADVVIATGEAEAIASIRARVQSPVITYGPRISIGAIGEGWTRRDAAWWREVAREIVLWDQKGCLSPRVLLVAGDPAAAAEALAETLAHWETVWPAAPRSAAEAAAVHAWRARTEVLESAHAGLAAPASTAWTVTWDDRPTLQTGPPVRVVRLAPLPDLDAWERLLRDERLQGVGHAFLPEEFVDAARAVGIARVAPLETLQAPPAGWRADGRSGLAELLRWGRRFPRRTC